MYESIKHGAEEIPEDEIEGDSQDPQGTQGTQSIDFREPKVGDYVDVYWDGDNVCIGVNSQSVYHGIQSGTPKIFPKSCHGVLLNHSFKDTGGS